MGTSICTIAVTAARPSKCLAPMHVVWVNRPETVSVDTVSVDVRLTLSSNFTSPEVQEIDRQECWAGRQEIADDGQSGMHTLAAALLLCFVRLGHYGSFAADVRYASCRT